MQRTILERARKYSQPHSKMVCIYGISSGTPILDWPANNLNSSDEANLARIGGRQNFHLMEYSHIWLLNAINGTGPIYFAYNENDEVVGVAAYIPPGVGMFSGYVFV